MKTRGGLSSRPRSNKNHCNLNKVYKVTEEKIQNREYRMSFRVPREKTLRDLVYTITAEMTKKRGDRMSFGVAPMKIPRDLYDLIMKAVSLRKHLDANPDDESAINKLLGAEYRISIVANYYKGMDLPRKWEYDPNIAITLVDNNCLVPLEFKDTIADRMASEPSPSPPREVPIPETSELPLNEKEKEIWLSFTDSDKETPVLESLSLNYWENETKSLELEHPIVSFIGNFAVNTFNKAYEMVVNEKEDNHISAGCLEFRKCEYLKTFGPYSSGIEYFFYMTIFSVEQGIPGLYKTKVVCNMHDGCRSLSRFVRVEPTPSTPSSRLPTTTPTESYLDYVDEDEDDRLSEEDDSCSEREDERQSKFLRTGLKRRDKKATCKGYDFFNPYGFDGP